MERKSTYRLVIQENSKAIIEVVEPEGEISTLNEFENAEAGQTFLDQLEDDMKRDELKTERINPFQLEVIATEKLTEQ